ncbi:MAG: hypothetical protein WCT99_04140 [Bacteroidota bacterium]|jgi:hypothetical protein
MHSGKIFILLFFFCAACSHLTAQSNSGFQSLLYPRSVSAAGLGEQGVAYGNAFGAMQYNPANLVYSENFSFSFFNNPWNILGFSVPLTAYTSSLKLENGIAAGIDYTYWNHGEFTVATIDQNPNGYSDGEKFHFYERSVAVAAALPVTDRIAAGFQARYVWIPLYPNQYLQHLLLSAGISAKPQIFSNRMTIGFSLMNFGTTAKYTTTGSSLPATTEKRIETVSLPSQVNLGIEETVVSNNFSEINLSFGAMKPIVQQDGAPSYEAHSSFSALFTDWKDFPNDVTGQIGLGILLHPIDLGKGISFFQEMNVGYFSAGPKEYSNSFMTHGVTVGIRTRGITASAGYAGRWHNFTYNSYLLWYFPWETFQFSITSDLNREDNASATTDDSPRRILLSAGYAYGAPVGKMKEMRLSPFNDQLKFETNNQWSLEADFYVSEQSAIHAAVRYARLTEKLIFIFPSSSSIPPLTMVQPSETVSFESGYRYHPFELFNPFFIQGSLGIIRLNPVVERSYPRYLYQTYTDFTAGFVIPFLETGIVLIPNAGLKTIFMKEYSNPSRLGGYNQVEAGVSIGYEL